MFTQRFTRLPSKSAWVSRHLKFFIGTGGDNNDVRVFCQARDDVHAVDGAGRRVVARALKRDQFLPWCTQHLPAGCLVAMEACSGAHHWARQLMAAGFAAQLIAPHLVTPYRMEGCGGKNDATDAASICEAASRPQMRFVPIKTTVQQGLMAPHAIREGFKQDRTAWTNRIRGVLAEFGLVFGKSPKVLRAALPDVLEDASNELSGVARMALQQALDHWRGLDDAMQLCDRQMKEHVRSCDAARRAARVIGIGELGASAFTASVADFHQSSLAGNSVPGWASCRARTPRAARPAWGVLPSAATTTCARC